MIEIIELSVVGRPGVSSVVYKTNFLVLTMMEVRSNSFEHVSDKKTLVRDAVKPKEATRCVLREGVQGAGGDSGRRLEAGQPSPPPASATPPGPLLPPVG